MKQRTARGERGQALAEMGIVLLLFVFLVMGIIEFGRAWMIANMITHAAREGARLAAVIPPYDPTNGGSQPRNPNCTLNGTPSSVQQQVVNEMTGVIANAGSFTVAATSLTSNGVPFVKVEVTGTVPYLFNLPGVGTSFAVDRTITFRDEGC